MFPLTFSSEASLMQSNLDGNFPREIVTSHKLFWIIWKNDGSKSPCQIGLKPLDSEMTQMTNIGIDSGNQLLILKNMCQNIVILVRPDKPTKEDEK